MFDKPNPIGLRGFASLTLALTIPIVGCATKEEPPVIDVTTPIKAPAAPTTNAVAPATPPAK